MIVRHLRVPNVGMLGPRESSAIVAALGRACDKFKAGNVGGRKHVSSWCLKEARPMILVV